MWETVDAGIAPGCSESLPINVLTDTAALYYRAQLAGVEVSPARWATLSRYAADKFPKSGQSFADIHAALTFAMAGDGAALDRIACVAGHRCAKLARCAGGADPCHDRPRPPRRQPRATRFAGAELSQRTDAAGP